MSTVTSPILLDSTGQGIKNALFEIANRLGSKSYRVWGVDIDTTNSNPKTALTYVGEAVTMEAGSDEWDTVFGHRPCIMVDGEVIAYLDPNDYSKDVYGNSVDITSLGRDVMIEFPKRGYKMWTADGVTHIRLTDNPAAEGYCYKPFSRNSEGDKDAFYIGAYKAYVDSNKMYSSSGKVPAASINRTNFRTYAAARGTGYAQSGWYQLIYRQILYILKYKGLDSQSEIGQGYALGTHTAAVNTGGANAYGMDCKKIKATNPTYMTDADHQVKCLGIEDFWGNIWEWVDGINTDASWNICTCYIPASFSDAASASGYTAYSSGLSADPSGYIVTVQGTADGGFAPKATGGSSGLYYCDCAHLFASRAAVFGGAWSYGPAAGAFLLYVIDAAAYAASGVGSRLMFV